MSSPGRDELARWFLAGCGSAARPQQLDAVAATCDALAADCAAPKPSNYLIQHATGSGKTLTIAALAHALSRLTDAHHNGFGMVLIVSDRVVLDEQLSSAVVSFFERLGEGSRVERVESCAHLRELLGRPTAGGRAASRTRVVVTTFQKASARSGAAGSSAADEDEDEDEEGP
eukprot:7373784-Prymnesium_polylepis.1